MYAPPIMSWHDPKPTSRRKSAGVQAMSESIQNRWVQSLRRNSPATAERAHTTTELPTGALMRRGIFSRSHSRTVLISETAVAQGIEPVPTGIPIMMRGVVFRFAPEFGAGLLSAQPHESCWCYRLGSGDRVEHRARGRVVPVGSIAL